MAGAFGEKSLTTQKQKKQRRMAALLLTLVLSLIISALSAPLAHADHLTVFHNASEILPGTFHTGNFTFPNNLSVTDRLGIGTTNFSFSDSKLFIENPTGNAMIVFLRSGVNIGAIGANTVNQLNIQSVNQPMRFSTDGFVTEHMRIATGGNVGIGTTSPSYKLEIVNASSALNVSGILFVNGTMGAVGIGTGNTGTDNLKLHVKGSDSIVSLRIETTATDGQASIRLKNDARQWQIGNDGAVSDNFIIRDSTADANRLAIDSSGNIGIGTTSPTSKLHVIGTINATAFVGDGSNLTGLNNTDSRLHVYNSTDWLGWKSTADGIPKIEISAVQTQNAYWQQTGNDIYYTTGNVGIGTTGPGAKLEIKGTDESLLLINRTTSGPHYLRLVTDSAGRAMYRLERGSAIWDLGINTNNGGTDNFIISEGGTTNPRMTIDRNGNVGIGTTTPSTLLQVGNGVTNGRVSIVTASSSSGGPALNVTEQDTVDSVLINSTHASFNNNALLVDTTRAANSAFNLINLKSGGTTQFLVRGDGNVGINTTSPAAKLDVRGADPAIQIRADSGGAELRIQEGGSSDTLIRFRDSAGTDRARFQTAVSGFFMDSVGRDIVFRPNDTERVRFTQAGNVGIGTASPGTVHEGVTSKLEVNGSITSEVPAGSLSSFILSRAGDSKWQFLTRSGENDNLAIYAAATGNTSDRVTITQAGNVGINTTNPVHKLHVSAPGSSNTVRLSADVDADNENATIEFTSGTRFLGKIKAQRISTSDGALLLSTRDADAEKITMTLSDGNVGIGTTSPQAPLQVARGAVGTLPSFNSGVVAVFGSNPATSTQAYVTILGGNAGGSSIAFADQDNEEPGRITYAHDTNAMAFRVNSAERVRIDSSGNVGIGTTGPGKKLHVAVTTSGDGINVSGTAPTITAYASSAGDPTIESRGGTSGIHGIFKASGQNGAVVTQLVATRDTSDDGGKMRASTGIVGTTTNHDLDIFSNATARITIKNDGNVGIGTTSPVAKLHVEDLGGTNNVERTLMKVTGAFEQAGGTNDVIKVNYTPSSGTSSRTLNLITRSGGGTVTYTIDASQNVAQAIGVFNFKAQTDAGGATQTFARMEAFADSVAAGSEKGSLRFYTNGSGTLSERMRIDSSGKVGIGTQSPTSSYAGTSVTVLELQDSTNNAGLAIDGASTGVHWIEYDESGTWKYVHGYDSDANRFWLATTNSDGAGADADIIRIADGGVAVDFNGAVNANAFDYAEWMEKLDAKEQIEKADVVGIKDGKITKNTQNADLIMIVSTDPAMVGGNAAFDMNDEEAKKYYSKSVQIAFIGQIPVKVTGTAKPGDYLLPSGRNDGTAIAISADEITFSQYKKSIGIVLKEFEMPANARDAMKPLFAEMLAKAQKSGYKLYLVGVGVK